MKKVKSCSLTPAFTMVELIFIMIVIGILAGTMAMNMPDNRIFSDINFITQKIKVKQLYALSYDDFDYTTKSFVDGTTCVHINKDALNLDEKNHAKAKPYQLSSQTTITPNDLNVCFDNLGRPYKLNNFLKMPIELNITYKGKTKTLNIMPYSGYIVKK
jgi:hypothetical protein